MESNPPVSPASSPSPTVSVVIPAYNEEENLRTLCDQVAHTLEGEKVSYEIIIVDDGSHDGTWRVTEILSRENSRVVGLRLSRNFGHQHALLAGLHTAAGDAVVTMDADLQHPPELLPILLERWRSGFRIVNTVRIKTQREPLSKRIASRLFYRVFSWLAGSSLKEGMADFRLLDRRVVAEITHLNEPHIFLRGLVHWVGFAATEVPFTAPARARGTGKYSWHHMLRLALAGITSFSIVPLRFSIFIGFLTALAAFAELCYALVIALVYKTSIPGWASTLAVVSFLFGILFMILGVIGEYIGRIYEAVKGRPHFIIEAHTQPHSTRANGAYSGPL